MNKVTEEFELDEKLNPTKNQKLQGSQGEPDSLMTTSPGTEDGSKIWIGYAVGAAICFTACNAIISEVTSKVGPLCLFYFAPGSILTALSYELIEMWKNCRRGKSCWLDQNIIIKGVLNKRNMVGFILFCITYFMI